MRTRAEETGIRFYISNGGYVGDDRNAEHGSRYALIIDDGGTATRTVQNQYGTAATRDVFMCVCVCRLNPTGVQPSGKFYSGERIRQRRSNFRNDSSVCLQNS